VEPEGYEYWLPERQVEAQQRELALTARFAAFLDSQGRETTREAIPAGETEIIYDLYDIRERILFEAKADAHSRPQLRMAIGQLLDYSYHGFEPDGRKALLRRRSEISQTRGSFSSHGRTLLSSTATVKQGRPNAVAQAPNAEPPATRKERAGTDQNDA